MQTREQWKGSRNWKLVTGAATAATLSLGALAIATSDADAAPPSITLDERAGVEASAGGFVPFDLGASIGLHAPPQIVRDNPYFEGGFFWDTRPSADDSRADQAVSVVAPPVTAGATDAVAASEDADEPTSVDVLSEEVGADEPAEPTGDDVADDAGTDGPAVTIADDPLSDDSVPDDDSDKSIVDDAKDSSPDDSDEKDSSPDDSDESMVDDAEAIVDDADDSIPDPDDSLDDPDDPDDSPDVTD